MKIKLKQILKQLTLLAALLAVSCEVSAFNAYLHPSSSWQSSSARFAVYVWNASGDKWYDMTQLNSSGYYYAEIDDSYTSGVIFCRMNPSTTENNWDNKWNKSQDLTKAEVETSVYKDNATTDWNQCVVDRTITSITGSDTPTTSSSVTYTVASDGSSYSWASTNSSCVSISSGGDTYSATCSAGSTSGVSGYLYVTYTKSSTNYFAAMKITTASCTPSLSLAHTPTNVYPWDIATITATTTCTTSTLVWKLYQGANLISTGPGSGATYTFEKTDDTHYTLKGISSSGSGSSVTYTIKVDCNKDDCPADQATHDVTISAAAAEPCAD